FAVAAADVERGLALVGGGCTERQPGLRRPLLVEKKLVPDCLLDRAGWRGSDREFDPQHIVRGGKVGHPAVPGECKALAHQKSVAGMLCRRRVVAALRIVEAGEDALAAPIAEFVEQGAVALCEVHGPQD